MSHPRNPAIAEASGGGPVYPATAVCLWTTPSMCSGPKPFHWMRGGFPNSTASRSNRERPTIDCACTPAGTGKSRRSRDDRPINTVDVDVLKVFYHRSVGDQGALGVLLLHGFPSLSHMFRGLTSKLASARHHQLADKTPQCNRQGVRDPRTSPR
jgi:hypothetical protein